MTHKGLEGVLNDLHGLVEIAVVEFSIDHYLGDYTPFVRLVKRGGLTPEEIKSINQRGMVILSTECNDCECSYQDEEQKNISGVQVIAVTPIDKSVENRNLVKWIEDIKAALKAASE